VKEENPEARAAAKALIEEGRKVRSVGSVEPESVGRRKTLCL
jgi:hypothetical protein